MKQFFLSVTGFAFLLFFISQCKHEPELNLTNTPTISSKCDSDTVYFVNDILPLIQSACAKSGCHDAVTRKYNIQLTDYLNIIKTGDIRAHQPSEGEFVEVVESNNARKVMPPPPNMKWTSAQIAQLKKWIAQGALNNECREKICDTMTMSFANNISPIIKANCEGCHSGALARKGVRLENYTQIKAAADNGSLEGTIFHINGYAQMPTGGALDSCTQKKVKAWLNLGAPNN